MHEIILIEDFTVDRAGNLNIIAILENMGTCTHQQTYLDPPEFAPARCKTSVCPESLPVGINFIGKTTDQLEEMVNRYCLLVNQEWEVLIEDNSDADCDLNDSGARMFF